MKKIAFKITSAIIVCSIIISILLGGISIFQSSNHIEQESFEKLEFMAKNYSNEFSQDLRVVENTTNNLASHIKSTIDIPRLQQDPEYMNNYLENIIAPNIKATLENIDIKVESTFFYFNPKLSGKAGDVWYADLEGNGHFERQEQIKLDAYDPNDEDMTWFYDHSKEKNKRWGDPYIYGSMDMLIVPYTMAIYDHDTFIGVVGMDMAFDEITAAIQNMKVYNSGYAVLLNDQFDYLVHPTLNQDANLKTIENGELKYIAEEINKNHSGIISYQFKNENKVLGFSHLTNGWVLAVDPPANEIFKPVKDLKNMLMLFTILGIGISIIFALYIGKSIAKPIVKVTEIINKTSDFDLIYDKDYEALYKYKDETGIMVQSMSELRKSLRHFANELLESSKDITKNADKVEMLTVNLRDQADNTSATTQQLSAGMEETAATSEEINASTQEINDAVSNIAKKAKKTSLYAKDISIKANKIKEDAICSSKKSQDIYMGVKKDLDLAIEEAKAVEKINLLADSILNITKQTNLLALNAAIEASRAGEAGRGFAVVADEIRNLAEQSSKTIIDIQNIVKVVNASVGNLVSNSQKILTFIDEDVNKDYSAFIETSKQYSKDVSTFNNIMMDFSATSEELQASIESISSAIDEVSKTTNEGASGVEDIAVKTSNIVENLVDIQKITSTNLESANRLKNNVSKFKL